jgi:hypothetical protein
VLISVERLLIKLRQPRSRADELIALRERLRAERASQPDGEEREYAAKVHARKLAVTAQLSDVTSCRSCATGAPWPRGHYDGGDCCSGVTAELFDDAELSALARAGTRPRDLTPPSDDHAGCAFRGARGCSLDVSHRPARCVHYICDTLRRELHDRHRLDAIERDLAELDQTMQQFRVAREARLQRELAAPLLAGLADAARQQK